MELAVVGWTSSRRPVYGGGVRGSMGVGGSMSVRGSMGVRGIMGVRRVWVWVEGADN